MLTLTHYAGLRLRQMHRGRLQLGPQGQMRQGVYATQELLFGMKPSCKSDQNDVLTLVEQKAAKKP